MNLFFCVCGHWDDIYIVFFPTIPLADCKRMECTRGWFDTTKRKSCSSTGTAVNWRGRCSFCSRGVFLLPLLAVCTLPPGIVPVLHLLFNSRLKVGSSGEVIAVDLCYCQFLCEMLCISLQIWSWEKIYPLSLWHSLGKGKKNKEKANKHQTWALLCCAAELWI